MLNDLIDSIGAEFGERLSDSDFQMIKTILVGCSRGYSASRIEQIYKVHPYVYGYVIGFLGDGEVPPYVGEDSRIGVGAGIGGPPIHIGTEGDVWFDKDSGQTYVWHITDWVSVGE